MSNHKTYVSSASQPQTVRFEMLLPLEFVEMVRTAQKYENTPENLSLFFKEAGLARVQQAYLAKGRKPPVVRFRTRGEKIKK